MLIVLLFAVLNGLFWAFAWFMFNGASFGGRTQNRRDQD